jgi:hypothetical protein
VRTATEEIDIDVLNDSAGPRFRRESAIILAECKGCAMLDEELKACTQFFPAARL